MSEEDHILYIILVSVKNDLIQFALTHHVKLHKGLIAIIDFSNHLSLSLQVDEHMHTPTHAWTKTLTHVPNCSLSVYSLFARIYPWEEEVSVQLGENGCHHRLCLCTNKWLNLIGERGLVASTSRSGIVMEKPAVSNHEQQQQWAVLKCPRCESSNTKFCYFNNYSLSQPRHFCKACKRYWTRGGTLRNVPVGGGCRRKNKRVKRPSSGTIMDGASCSASSSVSFATNPRPTAQPQIMDTPSSSATLDHTNSPLLYGIPTNRSDMNDLQFPSTRFNSTTVPTVDTLSGFDHLTGLGEVPPFSSGFGFAKEITFQGAVSTSNSLLPSYNSIFGSSSCSASSPTMASFFLNGNGTLKQLHQTTSHLQTLPPFQNQLQQGNREVSIDAMKMKVEGDKNRLQGWSNVTNQVGLLDSSLYWNSTTVNDAWHDPANAGSSQPPL